MTNKHSNRPRKKKNLNNLLILAVILTILAVSCAIFLLIILFKSNGDSDIKDISSEYSEVSEVSVSNTGSKNIKSNSSNLNETDISEESEEEPSQSYEEYIGVNYKIDISEWEQYICPENEKDYLFLVDSSHPLASDYVPPNLTDVVYTRKDNRKTQQMVGTAEKALQAFLLEGAEYGVNDVTVTSAYRSYSYQNYLFNYYCEQHQHKFDTRAECEAHVLTFSTKPGTSEHQSGLACDMHNLPAASTAFSDTKEAKWLAENAHRFGFILRYPEDKTEITKIQYEPWHFRFVGRTAATEMFEKGLCLEEYIELIENNNFPE